MSNAKKKNRNVVSRRQQKTKSKTKTNSSAKKGSGKRGQQNKHKGNARNVRRAGKYSSKKALEYVQREKEIRRDFEALLKADLYEEKKLKSVPGAKVVKRKGKNHKNLFEIPLPQKGVQNKVRAIINSDWSNIRRYLNNRYIEPLFVYVTLKIQIPDEKNFTFEGKLSPSDMVINTENTRDFAKEVLIDYNNRAIDSIQSGTSSGEMNGGKVWNVVMLSLRFLYR